MPKRHFAYRLFLIVLLSEAGPGYHPLQGLPDYLVAVDGCVQTGRPWTNWYGRVVFLQFSKKDGAPVFTLTSEELQPLNRPGDDYLKVGVHALKREAGLSEKEIAHYLWDSLRYGKKLPLQECPAEKLLPL